jgi:hypothetical protein
MPAQKISATLVVKLSARQVEDLVSQNAMPSKQQLAGGHGLRFQIGTSSAAHGGRRYLRAQLRQQLLGPST